MVSPSLRLCKQRCHYPCYGNDNERIYSLPQSKLALSKKFDIVIKRHFQKLVSYFYFSIAIITMID
jgi:hypothetical protein